MTLSEITRLRLYNQRIAATHFTTPGEVVAWLGAMQAQDYAGAKWSIGLRLPEATDEMIEQAIAAKTIVRTWPMRGTLHFVAPEDARWLLTLLTPRVIAQTAGRYRQLQLDEAIFARSKELFAKALQGGKQLTREEMYQLLERDNISAEGQRGYHILCRSAQDGLICFGAPSGKQQTFTLLEEWAPQAKLLEREEALATLTRRYFTGHGPATVPDFAWWAGLTLTEARAGLELVKSNLHQETIGGQTYWLAPETPGIATHSPSVMEPLHPEYAGIEGGRGSITGRMADKASPPIFLLPGFDEYMLGYKDRRVILEAIHAQKIVPGNNGIFNPTLVIEGKVVGIWKRTFKKETVIITVSPFEALSEAEKEAIGPVAERYGRFVEKRVNLL